MKVANIESINQDDKICRYNKKNMRPLTTRNPVEAFGSEQDGDMDQHDYAKNLLQFIPKSKIGEKFDEDDPLKGNFLRL